MMYYDNYQNRTTHIYQYLNRANYGSFDTFRAADEDSYILRLSWKHGYNQYFVDARISRRELLVNNPVNLLEETILDMLKLRDAKVRDVIFWTSCVELK